MRLKFIGLLYANQKAIEKDLSWLEDNGLIGSKLIDPEIKIEVLDSSSAELKSLQKQLRRSK